MKILVVEDEILVADEICKILQKLDYEVLEPAINYTEALNIIENDKPDLAILDIQLSGTKTGIDIAKKINEDYHIPFIFLSSHSDKHIIESAKQVFPAAYLVKPFTKKELFVAIEISISNYATHSKPEAEEELIINDAFFVKHNGKYHKIPFNTINFIKSDHIYLEVHLKSGQNHSIRNSLNYIITKLPSSFIRVHKSYIINTKSLEQINGNFVRVNHLDIPIGKTYRDQLLQKLNLVKG